jgi:hypothetical protein
LTANRLKEIFRLLIGCVGYEFAPRAQKIRQLYQAAESSVEIFVQEITLPHIDPSWVKTPCRLQWQVVGFDLPNHSSCLTFNLESDDEFVKEHVKGGQGKRSHFDFLRAASC